jgi:hypothetical protein
MKKRNLAGLASGGSEERREHCSIWMFCSSNKGVSRSLQKSRGIGKYGWTNSMSETCIITPNHSQGVYLAKRRTTLLTKGAHEGAQRKVLCKPQCSANSDMSWIQQKADQQASSKKRRKGPPVLPRPSLPVLYKCRKRLTERTKVTIKSGTGRRRRA